VIQTGDEAKIKALLPDKQPLLSKGNVSGGGGIPASNANPVNEHKPQATPENGTVKAMPTTSQTTESKKTIAFRSVFTKPWIRIRQEE
jgi:hypothetical protein